MITIINPLKILLILIILFEISCSKSPSKPKTNPELSLVEKLQKIPCLQITELSPVKGFEKSFELIFSQLVDHQNQDGQQFDQRIFLHHIDENALVVFYTSGYSASPNFIQELTPKLGANQIMVTHRYMGDARPDPIDWQYLNIERAANDHHRIVEYFKSIYTGKWIGVGHSKSGMAALYHRRFYPDDVDATVAYVAPIVNGIDDPRFDSYLEQVGTEDCRNCIKNYQKLLLENRNQILPMIQAYMDNSSLTYNVDPGIILEYEVFEYPFAFWQYNGSWSCESIPDSTATINELYQHLEDAGGFPLYTDEYMDFYSPVYYQAYTELGWYRLINDDFADLLVSDPNPSYSFFIPSGVNVTFQPMVMQDIEEWLKTEGTNIVYIYGELDPWTAAAIDLAGQTNVLKIVQPNANHNVLIDQLDNPNLVYSKLEEWLNIQINRTGESTAIPGMLSKRFEEINMNYQLGR